MIDAPVEGLLARVRRGERSALARLISVFEDGALTLAPALADTTAGAVAIGVTGPPGAGKSTLTSALVTHARSLGLRVGVLAVDPSSPRTGGALLGDRVRMGVHAGDPDVYIRGLASRGRTGGLTDVLPDAMLALELWGAHLVLVETVGVGQSAVDIAGIVDSTLLVTTVAGGDEIQAAKAGVLEVADVVAVNKADLPGAAALASSIRSMLRLHRGGEVSVVRTCARDGTGIAELWPLVYREERAADRTRRRHTAALRRVAVAVGDAVAALVAEEKLDADGAVAGCIGGEVSVDEVVGWFVHRLSQG